MIWFEAAPDDDRWVGRFSVGNRKVRLCGHRHLTEQAAEKCAGARARVIAKEQQ